MSRGMEAIDSKSPKGLPHSILVGDRYKSYFKMNVKDHQVSLVHMPYNAEYLNKMDAKQNWSRRFIHLISHAITSDDFPIMHSIAETVMNNGYSKFNAIHAVVQ